MGIMLAFFQGSGRRPSEREVLKGLRRTVWAVGTAGLILVSVIRSELEDVSTLV